MVLFLQEGKKTLKLAMNLEASIWILRGRSCVIKGRHVPDDRELKADRGTGAGADARSAAHDSCLKDSSFLGILAAIAVLSSEGCQISMRTAGNGSEFLVFFPFF